jgi:hypothetical protein
MLGSLVPFEERSGLNGANRAKGMWGKKVENLRPKKGRGPNCDGVQTKNISRHKSPDGG